VIAYAPDEKPMAVIGILQSLNPRVIAAVLRKRT
jgi:hypothetical protein